jgi:hypothetical protein
LARRFKLLGDTVAAATTLEALEEAVTKGVKDALEATDVRLAFAYLADDPVPAALAEIGEPVRRRELLRVAEPRARRWPRSRRRDALAAAAEAARPTVAPEHLPPRVEVFVRW